MSLDTAVSEKLATIINSQHALEYRLPQRIRKRDGREQAFDSRRIEQAILKAAQSTGEFSENEAKLISTQALKVLAHLSDDTPGIERIQDTVEQVLISANYLKNRTRLHCLPRAAPTPARR